MNLSASARALQSAQDRSAPWALSPNLQRIPGPGVMGGGVQGRPLSLQGYLCHVVKSYSLLGCSGWRCYGQGYAHTRNPLVVTASPPDRRQPNTRTPQNVRLAISQKNSLHSQSLCPSYSIGLLRRAPKPTPQPCQVPSNRRQLPSNRRRPPATAQPSSGTARI